MATTVEGSRDHSVVLTVPYDGKVEHIWEQPPLKDEYSPQIHAMMRAVAEDIFCSWCADMMQRHCLLDARGRGWVGLGMGSRLAGLIRLPVQE